MATSLATNWTRFVRPCSTIAFSFAAASCARLRDAGSAPRIITGPSSQETAARPPSTISGKNRGE